MRDENSKWNHQQRHHLQNIQVAHAAQYQKNKQPNQRVGKRPKQTFLQRRHESVRFSSVQSLSCIWLFVTPWTEAHQASLCITNSQSLLKLMSIDSVMPSNHLILCHPFSSCPQSFLATGFFSNDSVIHNRWPRNWNFNLSISLSNKYSGLISFRIDWLDFLAVQGSAVQGRQPVN